MHVVLGGLVVAYGGIVIASNASDCKDHGSCFTMTVPALVGLAIAGWGLATWLGSKNAAEDTSMKLPPRAERIGPRRGLPPPPGMLPPPPGELPTLAPPGAAPAELPPASSAAPPASAAPEPSSTAPPPPPAELPPPGVDW